MPRNNRKSTYDVYRPVRISTSMDDRLARIASRRRTPKSVIARLALSRGVTAMEQDIDKDSVRYRKEAQIMGGAIAGVEQEEVEVEPATIVYQGQRVRIKDLKADMVEPGAPLHGQVTTVVRNDLDGFTHAGVILESGPYSVLMLHFRPDGKHLGDFTLEVEDGEGDSAHWRKIDGENE